MLKYCVSSYASPNVSALYLHINKADLNFQDLAAAFFILTQFSQESSLGVLLIPSSPCELSRVFSHSCFLFHDFYLFIFGSSLRSGIADWEGENTNCIVRETAGWLLGLLSAECQSWEPTSVLLGPHISIAVQVQLARGALEEKQA